MVTDSSADVTGLLRDQTSVRPGSAVTRTEPLVVLIRTTATFAGAGQDMSRPYS
jgi:hypothetical protein